MSQRSQARNLTFGWGRSTGVLHWHAGETESFGEEQGLPDPQVQSVAISGDKTYVGTVLGVAVFERGHFSRTLAAGVLTTALLPDARQLLVGSEDQGVIGIPLEGRRPNSGAAASGELGKFTSYLEWATPYMR